MVKGGGGERKDMTSLPFFFFICNFYHQKKTFIMTRSLNHYII